MASFVYTTKAGHKVFIEADNQLEALRDIIFYEPNTQGIKLYTYAAWMRRAKK